MESLFNIGGGMCAVNIWGGVELFWIKDIGVKQNYDPEWGGGWGGYLASLVYIFN